MAQKMWLGLLGLFCVAPCLAMSFAELGSAAQQDPRDPWGSQTIAVQKHPSKWDYPREVTVLPGQVLHIVVRGDTLWGLGQKYLGSPYAWPQIWEQNKWVLDPHWIYPGDPLIVTPGNAVIGGANDNLDPSGYIANLPPGAGGIRIDGSGMWVNYAFSFQDYLQLPYLAPKGADAHFRELGAARITGNQKESRGLLSKGDVVYLDGGQAKGHRPGDRMMVLKVAKSKLIHPDDTVALRPIGDVIQHAAVLRVLAVHPRNSEAVIEDTLDGIEIGDHAIPYVDPVLIQRMQAPLRRDTLEPIQTNTTAKIVYGRNGAAFLSTGSLVLIDKGTRAGFKVGDMLVCLRQKTLANGGAGSAGGPQTNIYLGQMLIVKADEGSSTCLIVFTKSEMTSGDVVTD